MLERKPGLDPDTLKKALQNSAKDLGTKGRDDQPPAHPVSDGGSADLPVFDGAVRLGQRSCPAGRRNAGASDFPVARTFISRTR